MTVLEKALAEFQAGPAILGVKTGSRPSHYPTSKTVNGKRYKIVWVSAQTNRLLGDKLESVDGGIIFRLKDHREI
jgi:hypothetical protein